MPQNVLMTRHATTVGEQVTLLGTVLMNLSATCATCQDMLQEVVLRQMISQGEEAWSEVGVVVTGMLSIGTASS